MAELQTIVKTVFPGKKVVIVGDLVADQFLNGAISRVSREAPVFILRHEETVTLPGAAANAAANIASLGGTPILLGIAGRDVNGALLVEQLEKSGVSTGHIVTDPSISTTTKVRVLAGQHYAARQQVIRIDYEDPAPVSETLEQKLMAGIATAGASADAIIVSDYNCGSVTPKVFEAVRSLADKKNIPLIVDSRYHLEDFPNAATATPNREEVEKILGENFTAADCEALRERLGYQALLVTNGNAGMTLFEKDKPCLKMDAIGPREPVDVTGAGDTVIAAYALALAGGLGFADAARIANHAGGIVVMKKRTAVATAQELYDSIVSDGASQISTHAG
jgi:D-glycero-beta-D-manno-heptose-7-phosphate kinase